MLRFGMLWIVFVAALFIGGCTFQSVAPCCPGPSVTSVTEEVATPPASDAPMGSDVPAPITAEVLRNMAYTLDIISEEPVQLTAGQFEDSANQMVVNWIDTYALGELNGTPAAAVVLLANSGGSGNFSILSVVVEQDGAPVNVASALLGDRLRMNWIEIVDNAIVMDLVTQGPDEPMCCGTQRTLVNYTLEGEALVAGDAAVIGAQPQITATQTITFVPATVPAASETGSCFANAIGLGRADAWRCTTDNNLIVDPCFEVAASAAMNTTGEAVITCGANPITGDEGFVLELSEPLPALDPGEAVFAWLIELSDGTICERMTGTIPGTRDQGAPYGCADEAQSFLMENFITFEFDPHIYAQRAVFDLGETGFTIRSSVRVPVATIWR